MWKDIVEPDRSQMTKWLTFFAYWIPQPTDIRLEYVLLMTYPRQQILA